MKIEQEVERVAWTCGGRGGRRGYGESCGPVGREGGEGEDNVMGRWVGEM